MKAAKEHKPQQSRIITEQLNRLNFQVIQKSPSGINLNDITGMIGSLTKKGDSSNPELVALNKILALCNYKTTDLQVHDQNINYSELKVALEEYSQNFKSGINVKSKISLVKAHIELERIINIQLQNNSTRMLMSSVRFVIIPNDMEMTELPEFTSLSGRNTGVGGARKWEEVRGVGGVEYNGNTYVGVAEENLLGLEHKIWGKYDTGYSTATHEIAHAIHLNGLQKFKKDIITKEYNKRKQTVDQNNSVFQNDWVDGPYFSGKRLKSTNNIGTIKLLGKSPCYASQNEQEYFAQLSNAYLGTNTGKDPFTKYNRNNGKQWVKDNEPQMFDLLETIYKDKSVNDVDKSGNLVHGGVITNP